MLHKLSFTVGAVEKVWAFTLPQTGADVEVLDALQVILVEPTQVQDQVFPVKLGVVGVPCKHNAIESVGTVENDCTVPQAGVMAEVLAAEQFAGVVLVEPVQVQIQLLPLATGEEEVPGEHNPAAVTAVAVG